MFRNPGLLSRAFKILFVARLSLSSRKRFLPEQHNPTGVDAYTPAQMAARVATAGVGKAHLPALSTLMLALLGGAFIAFGGMFYTLVVAGSDLGFGPTRLLGGVAFSLGLILVIVGGAELFTGNALIVMAWACRRISTAEMLRIWLLVYCRACSRTYFRSASVM